MREQVLLRDPHAGPRLDEHNVCTESPLWDRASSISAAARRSRFGKPMFEGD